MTLRITQSLTNVLYVLAQTPSPHHPYDLATRAAVTQGAIYHLMERLEQHGLVTSTTEQVDPVAAGRPARRLYTLTAAGQAYAQTVNKTRAP